MRFKFPVYLLSIITVIVAQTPQDVLRNLTTLQSKVTTLDKAINAFPNSGGNLTQALAIHTDALDVQSATDATTNATVAVSTPISETNGRSIINAISVIIPTIKDMLSAIVKKKPAFDALPLGGVSGIVKQDLKLLNTSTSKLETALVAHTPADLIDEATSLVNELSAAFATAMLAYSNP